MSFGMTDKAAFCDLKLLWLELFSKCRRQNITQVACSRRLEATRWACNLLCYNDGLSDWRPRNADVHGQDADHRSILERCRVTLSPGCPTNAQRQGVI